MEENISGASWGANEKTSASKPLFPSLSSPSLPIPACPSNSRVLPSHPALPFVHLSISSSLPYTSPSPSSGPLTQPSS